MEKWIDATKTLPENHGRSRSKCVLAYCPEIQCQFTACYNFDNNGWEYFAVGSVDVNYQVSHWRKLPDNPIAD